MVQTFKPYGSTTFIWLQGWFVYKSPFQQQFLRKSEGRRALWLPCSCASVCCLLQCSSVLWTVPCLATRHSGSTCLSNLHTAHHAVMDSGAPGHVPPHRKWELTRRVPVGKQGSTNVPEQLWLAAPAHQTRTPSTSMNVSNCKHVWV